MFTVFHCEFESQLAHARDVHQRELSLCFIPIRSQCNFYFKSKFAREQPKMKDKITKVEKIPCKVTTALNLV
jgi:hypothetical protein